MSYPELCRDDESIDGWVNALNDQSTLHMSIVGGEDTFVEMELGNGDIIGRLDGGIITDDSKWVDRGLK